MACEAGQTPRRLTDSAPAFRVHDARQLQGVAVDQVSVGGGDGQDDAGGVADVLQHHLADALLDVGGLVAHGHLGNAGQVHQRHRPAQRRQG